MNAHLWNIVLPMSLLLLSLTGLKADSSKQVQHQPSSWEYCYTEGATEFFIVNSVTYQLMQVRSGGVDSDDDFQRIELRVNFSVPHLEEKTEPQASLLDVFYKVSIWHESSGAKITYRGPYSVCDDFLLSSSCNIEATSSNTSHSVSSRNFFIGEVSKPLHRNDGGVYELDLTFYRMDDTRRELLCITVPFDAPHLPDGKAAATGPRRDDDERESTLKRGLLAHQNLLAF